MNTDPTCVHSPPLGRGPLQNAFAICNCSSEPFGSNFLWAGRLQGAFAIWNCSRATYECSGPSCNCSRDEPRFCNCSRDSAIAAEILQLQPRFSAIAAEILQLQIAIALCRPSAQGKAGGRNGSAAVSDCKCTLQSVPNKHSSTSCRRAKTSLEITH